MIKRNKLYDNIFDDILSIYIIINKFKIKKNFFHLYKFFNNGI